MISFSAFPSSSGCMHVAQPIRFSAAPGRQLQGILASVMTASGDDGRCAAAPAGPGASALDALWPQVYDEMRRLARRSMRGQRPEHTLQPTALVHEAYLKLSRAPGLDASDRSQFLSLVARAMRQILVDHARAKGTAKRAAAGVRVELADSAGATPPPAVDLLMLNEALERLAALDERMVRIVELRYLAGLTVEEVAEVLGVSAPTVKRDAAMAKAWLFRELERS
jgi:RNA polymerase sigma-70 factor (ECF subfamily)